MDWTQVLTIVGANIVLIAAAIGTTITLFLWARTESREDRSQGIQALAQLSRDFHQEILSLRQEVAQESKDFHGRLISIEERGKK